MKKILLILLALLPLSAFAALTPTSVMRDTTSLFIRPLISTDNFVIPNLGGSGTRCVQVDNTGLLAIAGTACGSGGGGSGGGTWATTTSQVTGQLINYPLNDTDVVTIGSSATTTSEFYFDPNALFAKLGGQLLVTGSTTLQNFTFRNATGTSATTTSFFSTTASTTNLFGQFINGFGLSTCTTTNALTWSGGSFSCTAQPQGTVTSVTGTYPIISSGGATPNLTFQGLSTTSPWTIGQLAYVNSNNTLTSVATSSGTCTGSVSCLAFTVVGTVAPVITSAALTSYDSFTHPSAGTSATTSQMIFTNASSTFTGDLNITGNSTTTNATTTNLYVSGNASTTNFFGAGLQTCNTAGSSALIYTGSTGRFGCNTISGGSSAGGNSKWATSTVDTLAIYPSDALRVGIGTTTPKWSLQLASSTGPQLALSDGSLTSDHWTFRNKGGNLYLATSSPATFATSSVTALTINTNGVLTVPSIATGLVRSTAGVLSGAGTINNADWSGTDLSVANGGTGLSTFGGTNTVLYTTAADTLSSEAAFTYNPSTNTLGADIFVGSAGAVGAPAFTFTGDTNNGLYAASADSLDFTTNGVWRGGFTSLGRFTLGTTTPTFDLTVASTSPTFELDDTDGATNAKHLIMSFNSGVFAIGTSSDSTLTSTSTAVTITPGVAGSLYVASSSNLSNAGATFVTQGTAFMGGLTASAGLQTGIMCLSATNQVINESVACVASSKRFKKDINPLGSSLDKVLALKPVSFYYKPEFNGSLQNNPNFNGEQVGFIAEDVQKIDPRLISVETEGPDIGKPHTVRYENMTALLAGAIQELDKKIQSTKRSAEENWQWMALALLGLWNVWLTFRKK